MNDQEALMLLHQSGWKGLSLDGRDSVGETALMHSLRAYFKKMDDGSKQHTYDLHELTEYLISHPLIDVHAQDKEGHNALWYCYDYKHAYPLLAKAGLDFNQLNNEGRYFLEDCMTYIYDDEDIQESLEKLNLAFECGFNLNMEYQGMALWTSFLEPFRSAAEALVAHQERQRLEHLFDNAHVQKSSKKL